MSATLLDGRKIAAELKETTKQQLSQLREQGLLQPTLAVIIVGDDPASAIYVQHKQRACEETGIASKRYNLPATTTQDELTDLIERLNADPATQGILLQLPLPDHLRADDLLERIDPKKDVDGFHPYNLGRLAQRRPCLRSCTPFGIMTLLKHTQEDLTGQHAVIVGASNIVGRPMALELLLAKCTVTVCHRFTRDLAQHIQQADILISAIGKTGVINSEWIQPGSTVIDVGITRLADGSITGDIDFTTAKEKAAWITPVPGGVGSMTVATLMHNTLLAASWQADMKIAPV